MISFLKIPVESASRMWNYQVNSNPCRWWKFPAASMNKIKNVHSAPGMAYSLHGVRLTSLLDCPACKYGTLDRKLYKDALELYVCADCGEAFKPETLRQKGLIK